MYRYIECEWNNLKFFYPLPVNITSVVYLIFQTISIFLSSVLSFTNIIFPPDLPISVNSTYLNTTASFPSKFFFYIIKNTKTTVSKYRFFSNIKRFISCHFPKAICQLLNTFSKTQCHKKYGLNTRNLIVSSL